MSPLQTLTTFAALVVVFLLIASVILAAAFIVRFILWPVAADIWRWVRRPS